MVIIAFEFYLNGNFYFKISLISYKHCRGLLPNQLSSPGLAPMTEETSCGCIYLLFCLLLLAPRPPLQLLSSGNWIQFCNLGRKPVTFTTIKTNGRKEKNEIFSSLPALTYFPGSSPRLYSINCSPPDGTLTRDHETSALGRFLRLD